MSQCEEFLELVSKYSNSDNPLQQMWIIKPGENTNRGNGIKVLSNLYAVKNYLQEKKPDGKFVVQKYIHNPLLVGGLHWNQSPMRKFDIRIFGLAQIIDGSHFRGYYYKEGYIRTSSYPYDLSDINNRYIHLTNDAV